MSRLTISRAIASVLLTATVVTACGSDDDTATSPIVTFTTSPTATPATDGVGEPATTGSPAAPGDETTLAPSDSASPTDPTPTPTTSAPTGPTTPLGDPTITLTEMVELAEPVDVAWRTGDPTMFAVERGGRVVPVRDGVAGDPVLDISDLTNGQGEQGLLGLTFSLDGAYAYVDYTNDGGDTIIAEYTVGADGGFDAGSARQLLEIDQPYGNHNGGNVTIGPDGYLYIGMGDGGDGGDPERRGLDVGELLGKILRIDPAPVDGGEYSVPADNPFVDVDGARPEIWSVGVRNPWRFSFDRTTRDLWIGDVGQNAWEEIDVAWADEGGGRGVNFGWSAFEGTHPYNDDQPQDGVTMPIHEYEHGDRGCSVNGGAVYRGAAIPALAGWYLFSDYCSGEITGLRMDGKALAQTLTLATMQEITAIRDGPDGELFAISLGGTIAAITPG